MTALLALSAGCAALRLGGDDVFAVTAAERGAEARLRVTLAPGWHLNEEYPSGFEADGGATTALVVESETVGRVTVPRAPGELHLGFCDAERCRIEHLRYDPR